MIIAGGLTIAVIVGELDLSIGFAASMQGVLVTGLIVHNGLPIPVAIVVVIGVGALIGVLNGLIVTKARVNSVIATLGMGTIIVGLQLRLFEPACRSSPACRRPSCELSLGRWLYGIPHNIIIMVMVLGVLWFLVERTAIGQSDPGGRRQPGRGAPLRHQCRPHQDPRLRRLRRLRRAHRHPARRAPRQRHHQRRRQLSPHRLRRRLPRLGDAARRRVPRLRHLHRRVDHRVGLQRPRHLRRARPTRSIVFQGAILIVAVGLSSLGRVLSER